MMYLKPDDITIMRRNAGAHVIKNFGSSEVFVQRLFFDVRDAIDWCNANYYGTPYHVVG